MNTKLIGLTGTIGAGKDTTYGFLNTASLRLLGVPATRIAFGDNVKKVCYAAFGGIEKYYYGTQEEKDKTEGLEFWAEKLGEPYSTYRRLAQTVGTEVFRNHVNHDFWVLAAENQLSKSINDSTLTIVTDVRFDNEAELIRSKGGIVVNVINTSLRPKVTEPNHNHVSEDGIMAELVDYTIVASNLAELQQSAGVLFEQFYTGAESASGNRISL